MFKINFKLNYLLQQQFSDDGLQSQFLQTHLSQEQFLHLQCELLHAIGVI